ncbi:MAG: hypothetical protein H6860_02810 [Rhodospirillales bacterium]|nr:hypothetical protein [Alphaproteobacteria bacterium]MCB9981309.1 hypothetical protein [Rhodospirillales bacterium]
MAQGVVNQIRGLIESEGASAPDYEVPAFVDPVKPVEPEVSVWDGGDARAEVNAIIREAVAPSAAPKALVGSEFIAQKIGSAGSHMGKMAALDQEAFDQAQIILPRLEVELQRSPDLSDPIVQQQIEFMFNNDFGIADSYKAVAAQFVEERFAAGGPIDMTPYNHALEALRDGDVSRAQGLLRGERQESRLDEDFLQGQRLGKVSVFRENADTLVQAGPVEGPSLAHAAASPGMGPV